MWIGLSLVSKEKTIDEMRGTFGFMTLTDCAEGCKMIGNYRVKCESEY